MKLGIQGEFVVVVEELCVVFVWEVVGAEGVE